MKVDGGTEVEGELMGGESGEVESRQMVWSRGKWESGRN